MPAETSALLMECPITEFPVLPPACLNMAVSDSLLRQTLALTGESKHALAILFFAVSEKQEFTRQAVLRLDSSMASSRSNYSLIIR